MTAVETVSMLVSLPLKQFHTGLTDNGPFLSSQGRSSSVSSFYVPVLKANDDVMSLALCWQVVSQAPQHFRLSETQATSLVTVASAANLSAVHLPLPAKQAKGMTDGIKDTRTANQQVRQTEIGRDVVPTTQRNSPNSNQHSVVTTKLTHGRGPSVTGYHLACNIQPSLYPASRGGVAHDVVFTAHVQCHSATYPRRSSPIC